MSHVLKVSRSVICLSLEFQRGGGSGRFCGPRSGALFWVEVTGGGVVVEHVSEVGEWQSCRRLTIIILHQENSIIS